MKKTLLTIIIIICIILVFGVVGIAVYKSNSNNSNTDQTTIKDDKALYVGFLKKSTLSNGLIIYNILHINVYDDDELVFSDTIYGNDTKLIKGYNFGNEFNDYVFYDLREVMSNITSLLSIKEWSDLQVDKNFVTAQTEINTSYFSALSSINVINDCGIYLLGIPASNNEIVNVQHTYIYKNYVVEEE
ncbi:MAG: hypothetical protein LBV51_02640 [Acholeplasmatales bacterium]|jgi:hypothetical protein|nr:hypothetical protein [Acholeplasmatales bacterium]